MFMNRILASSLAGILAVGGFAHAASAGETRSYVLNWWGMATYSQESDCPEGQNPKADVMFRRILKEMGKTPKEIEEIYKDFPYPIYNIATDRGRIDGKPTNVYITPTSWPDPKIKTAQGTQAYGFNLDGNASTGGYVDVETGEVGVDNQLYRAVGCFETQRAMPPARPTYPYIYWDMTRDFTGAWLVEVSGIDDAQNDDDVVVGVYRALNPVTRDVTGNVIPDMSFKVDPAPRSQNVVHGKIKNGLLTTNAPFNFYMTGDPLAIIDYDLRRAHLRLQMKPDGTVSGVVAGYQDWRTIYSGFALPGVTNEINLSVDVPGIYYALKRLADGDPDPKTGENATISSSYSLDGIPAFIQHPPGGKVAAK